MAGIGTVRIRRSVVAAALTTGLVVASVAPAGAAAPPGSLDPTFGVRGVFVEPVATTLGVASHPVATLLARGAGGRTWLAGTQQGDPSTEAYLDRITSTGRQDLTFRAGHALAIGGGGDWTRTQALVATPDGGALVVVTRCCPGGGAVVEEGAVVRVRPNGLVARDDRLPRPPFPPDVSAGPAYGPGAALTPAGGVRVPVSFQVTGPAVGSVSLVGITATGQPDTAVGPSGTRAIPRLARLYRMVRDGSNRLYFVGTDVYGSLMILRTNLDGVLDTTYGNHGSTTMPVQPIPQPFRTGDAVVTQAGTIYVATTMDWGGRPAAAVVKLDPEGRPDPRFASTGRAVFPRSGAGTVANTIGFALGGRFVLGVTATSVTDPSQVSEYLVRATTTGAYDTAFGSGGWYRTVERNVSIVVDSSGRLLVAGSRPGSPDRPGPTGVVVGRLS